MTPESLYTICLERIYMYLKEGKWNSCTQNPFSLLPTILLNELMELSKDKRDSPQITDFLLLITSGKLKLLDLCPFDFRREQDFILSALQKKKFRGRNIDRSFKKLIFHFVSNLISFNPNLEELHSEVHPFFDVFLKCPKLRILKIYESYSNPPINNAPMNLSVLSSLRNLEVLHVFNMDTQMIETVLETCPKLISTGLTDSLDALEEIDQRLQNDVLVNHDEGRHFQLRRCVWGKERECDKKIKKYKSQFGCKITSAVRLCPLVQELIIHVYNKDGYEALRYLKQLTLLSINFDKCPDDIMPGFISLLQDIGPQLKHLFVYGKEISIRRNDRFPIDVIIDLCPYLHSLQLWGSIFTENSSKKFRIPPLKRLNLYVSYPEHTEGTLDEEESLLYLLSISKHLEELFLESVEFFNDTLLNEIFKRNEFTQLEVCAIEECNLTRRSFQKISEIASVKTVIVDAGTDQYFFEVNRLINDNDRNSFTDLYTDTLERSFFCNLKLKKEF